LEQHILEKNGNRKWKSSRNSKKRISFLIAMTEIYKGMEEPKRSIGYAIRNQG
jgi:hypothetical protein